MIVLDSDILIAILDKKTAYGDVIVKFLESINEEKVTTAINLEEVLFSIYKRTGKTKLERNHPLQSLSNIPFTKQDAVLAAEIELIMEKKGIKKPRGDVLIAAIVCRNKGKFITLNKEHFQDIPNLKVIEIPKQ
ncbi:MAG: type II toxin-antitoxin system VapC family toxin [Candidatus Heimdallarchaeaceae archaeon]